jgi:hypothetical protein
MTRIEAKKLAEKVTVAGLKFMFVNAYSKISDWTVSSRANKGLSRGKVFNVFTAIEINTELSLIIKTNMIFEFGEFLQDYQEPVKKNKKTIEIYHEAPNFLGKSFYEF